jgi:hypothetical protein
MKIEINFSYLVIGFIALVVILALLGYTFGAVQLGEKGVTLLLTPPSTKSPAVHVILKPPASPTPQWIIIHPPLTPQTSTDTPNVATGTVVSVTVEHNVYESFSRGMRIHTKFTVQNRKGVKCQVDAYFFSADGIHLKDQNSSQYGTADGQVAVAKSFTPGYDDTVYNDFQLFMPYNEFHLDAGEYDLYFYVKIYDFVSSQIIAQSDAVRFLYRKQ